MELNEAAVALGRRGGLKKSTRKAASSRANLERARRAKALKAAEIELAGLGAPPASVPHSAFLAGAKST